MKILFLTHAFNSLTQRLFVELRSDGHEVSVEFDINDTVAIEAVTLFNPDLIIAPFLKRAIPDAIWKHHTCMIVHPGIVGDRGPSSLDWAIINEEKLWGVTVLQANDKMDGGDIWAHRQFEMRHATKSSLYRHEITEAAVDAVKEAIDRLNQSQYKPTPLHALAPNNDHFRPLMPQSVREIQWHRDTTTTVLKKIRSADGQPGVRDHHFGQEIYLYDAHQENTLSGTPGEVIAKSGPAICIATVDGAVWIGHVRIPGSDHPFKLPATTALADEVAKVPEVDRFQEISYREVDGIGYLYFEFYNGAMSTSQCKRLLEAYQLAVQQPTQVIVLMGGENYWSNGMHLNMIEAAASAADESWRNINAIDDLAEAIINTNSHITVAALRGNAGAGGLFLARACDEVWALDSVIINPHYKDMGNLYGSEYWSYLLPLHAGRDAALTITESRLPMGVDEALECGLVDYVIDGDDLDTAIGNKAQQIRCSPSLSERLHQKKQQRLKDESVKPLSAYRQEELEMMHQNFYGFDPSYHVARYNFVYKVKKSRTPLTIAFHRKINTVHRRAS